MSEEQQRFAIRVADLRRAFDEGFAAKPRDAAVDETSFLGLRFGEELYAIRLAEVAGLFADKPIVPLTGRLPELLGITGIRGNLVPVFGLGRLLGYPAAPSPRWLIVAAPSAVGFAFDEFEGYLRAPASAIALTEGEVSQRQARETLVMSDVTRAIIGIEPLIESIRKRAGIVDAHKEH